MRYSKLRYIIFLFIVLVSLLFMNRLINIESYAKASNIGVKYEEAIKDSSKKILIVFHTEWCGFCKRLIPKIEELEPLYRSSYNFVIIDCDDPANKDVVKKYDIPSYPTLYVVNAQTGVASRVNPYMTDSVKNLRKVLDSYIEK